MRNLTFKAAMLNDSRTTVNRQSTDGQSQRHYKQTPLSKRWKVLMTLVFLFTFAIGNVWAAVGDAEVVSLTSGNITANYAKAYAVTTDNDVLADAAIYATSRSGLTANATNGIEPNYMGFLFKPVVNCKVVLKGVNTTTSTRNFSNKVYEVVNTDMYPLVKASSSSNGSISKYLLDHYTSYTTKTQAEWKDLKMIKKSGSNYLEDATNAAKTVTGEAAQTALYTQITDIQVISITKRESSSAADVVESKTFATEDGEYVFQAGKTYAIYLHRNSSGLYVKELSFVPVYQLTWDLDGGTITSAEDAYSNAGYYAKGTTLTAPTVEKTGADFTGWSPTVSTMPAVATTYKATWATACTAGVPGNVTKGALSADKITLTAEGSAADGDTWYWQTSEDGVDKSNSGSTYQASAAGTYYVRSFNSTANCWNVTAKSITLSADDFKAKYAITYDKGASGTGEIAAGEKTEGVDFTLSSDMFTRNNYLQVGWTKTDGTSREYMMGGKYTTDAAQKFYPAWAEKDTYVAAFHYDSENPTTPPAGWTFANAGTYTNTSATVAYVGKFTAEGETTASGKSMDPNHIAFAKNADADAVYDLGYVTTVSAVAGTLMIGSTSAKVASIDYLAADGSTVLHSFNITHNKADWGANNFNETEVVPNVRYIRINGKDFWQVLGAFSVTYGSLVPKYDLAFAKNGGSGADMATLRYAEDAVVTLPGCTFTAPTNKTFDAWVVTKTASSNPITVTDGKFTMPAEAVTATATWKFLPKLTLEAGEGATGVDVEAYYAAGTQISVPEKPDGFSNGTKEFTGWVYSQAVTIEADKFAMPSTDLTLTAQWASATAVAQILGGDSYETLEAALAAVADGQTIQMLQDYEFDLATTIVISGKAITLDLNGKNITLNGTKTAGGLIRVSTGATLNLIDNTVAADATIDDEHNITYAGGKFLFNNSGNDTQLFTLEEGCEMNINSGWYESNGRLIAIFDPNTTLNVTSDKAVLIATNSNVISGNGTAAYKDYKINISGGILYSKVTGEGTGAVIYHPNEGNLTISGGTLVAANGPAVVVRGGTTNVTGGTIEANGTGTYKVGDATLEVPADGIVWDFKSTYPGSASIAATISAGEISSVSAVYVGDTPTAEERAAVAVSGGTFKESVAEPLCAENYAPKDNGDGTYGVKPLATSIDFEALATTHGTGTTDVRSELEAKNYTFSGSISTSNGASWDAATGETPKPADKGLKIKGANGATLSFDVAAGKLVTLKVGSLKGGATIAVNGGTAEPLTGSNPLSTGAPVYTYYYSADAATYSIATTGTDYDIIQSVTIDDPYVVTFNANGGDEVAAATFYGTALTLPSASKGTEVFKGWYDAAEAGNLIGKAGDSYTPTANVTLHAQWETVSSDNTLSALEVDGVALADFDPEKHIYNIVCEYGHTPEITLATATAAAQGATVTIVNTPEDGDGYKYIQANVIPASGTPIGYNQVRYTNKPKLGVSLIKVTIPNGTGNTQTIEEANITGYIGGTATQKLENGKHKLGSGGHFIGMTLAEGTFQENDIVIVNVEEVKADLMRVFKENTASEDNVVASSTANMTVGDNYVTLGATTTNSLYLRRGTDGENYQKDWNPFIRSFEVQRLMDPFIAELKVGDALATIDEEANPKTITIEVPASTDITALTPSIKAYANGGATVTPADPQDFSAGAVEYTVTSYYGETTTYQVTVTKAEASHDATLSALSVAGYSLSPAFDPAVLTYNVELPKGTVIADLPAVSYTLNHVGATAVKTDAAALPGATKIVVTAEDGLEENKKTYTINFTVSTKDKVVIFDGATDEALRTVPAALATEGFNWVKNSNDADKFKYIGYTSVSGYTHAIATGGSSNASRNIAVTIPSKYEVQFEIAQASNSDAARHAYVGAANNTAYADALFSVESASKTDGQKATSEALAGGKTYYIHSDNSINILEINLYIDRVSEAPAISAQPAALAACDAATNTNALSITASVEAGTLSYQWYKVVEEGDDVAVGTNNNEFVPTAVGQYYVVVTNTEGSYKPSSAKSEIATVSLKAQTEITGFENAAAPLNTEKTLSVTATGTGTLTYKWQACTEAGVVTDENVLSSAATYGVTITEEPQYYLVTVEGECGSATQVLFAKKWADLELVDVDGSMTWNFAASNTGITEDVAVPSTMVLANAGQGAMPNTDNFHSDMLKAIVGSTGTAVRKSSTDDGCYQGTGIMFHTTVPGIVTVTYRGTGNNANVTLTVGSKTFDTYHGGFTTCDKVFVPAGDVEISSVGTMRIQEIVFNAKPDYTRNVTEGRYGTICLPNGGIMVGAALFEVAYYDDDVEKIFLDEVLNGEMVAGRPYIFLTKEGVDQIAVFYTDAANAPEGDYHGLFGSYSKIHLTANDHIYILKDNRYYFVDTDNVYCGENRAYFKMGVAGGISGSYVVPAPGRRRMSIGAGAPKLPTGIENTGFESEAPRKVLINGELYIIRGEKMYDAKGQLVK